MKSPFTGGEVFLKKELALVSVNDGKCRIIHHYYLCKDTNERFTTEELDTINYNQVKKAHRKYKKTNFLDDTKNNLLSL